MENLKSFWSESNQINLPVDTENNLLPFLSPTAAGTNYWDSPNEVLDSLSVREYHRIIGQAIEIYNIISSGKNISEYKTLLDVGTGNGLVPRLLGHIMPTINCIGIDPFLHGGHKTSWQKTDLESDMKLILEMFNKEYVHLKVNNQNQKNYKEYKLYLDEYLIKDDFERSDIVYCKAIEHVPNWKSFAKDLAYSASSKGKLIIKHRSFYSYLGPHRYATSSIPWGHCILDEKEYSEYIDKFHHERSKDMKEFFFNNLSNPRMTSFELIETLREEKMVVSSISYLKPKYYERQNYILNNYSEIVNLALSKNKKLSYEELTSGVIIYVFEKII